MSPVEVRDDPWRRTDPAIARVLSRAAHTEPPMAELFEPPVPRHLTRPLRFKTSRLLVS